MKCFSVVVLTSMFLAGCASSDIRNWDPKTKTGQIVVFTGEDMLTPPELADAQDALMESGRCPAGYVIKELGWRGGGAISIAKDTEDKVSTSSSINVSGKEVFSVERSRGSKSGKTTTVKVGGFQTAKTADGKGTTIVRSPAKSQSSSGSMRGKWYDFKCKSSDLK